MSDEFLWVEKYRPKNIEDCVLPADIKKTFFDIKDEIPMHIHRWKDEADYALQSVEDWQSELEVLRSFALQRPAIVRTHLKMKFNYTE